MSARVGETDWTKFLEKYHKYLWIQRRMMQILHQVLHDALYTPQVKDGFESIQQRIRAEVIGSDRRGYTTFDRAKAVGAIDQIAALLKPKTTTARAVRTIHGKMSNPANMVRWARQLETDWSAAVHRLERIRNSIMHGGPFTDVAVSRVHAFSYQLSAWSVVESMDAILENVTIASKHASIAQRMATWRRGLDDTDPYLAVFTTT